MSSQLEAKRAEWDEGYKSIVSKPDLIKAFRDNITADPALTDTPFGKLSIDTATRLYSHLIVTLGDFLIEKGRAVKLEDIGILALKFRKGRTGVSPYSLGEGDPQTYVTRDKRIMSLRRPFQYEIDEDGNPIYDQEK